MAAVAFHDQILDETHDSDVTFDACSPVLYCGRAASVNALCLLVCAKISGTDV